MKFPYAKIFLEERSALFGYSIFRPIVPVEIGSGASKRRIRYAALLDSGADFCLFPGQIGDYLGLEVADGIKHRFGGIQAGVPSETFVHEVILNIGDRDRKVKVGFSYDISLDGYGVLGQKGFFEIFAVSFRLPKDEIELKEIKQAAGQ